ncbi:MAG TPA: AAA family ATPase [Chlamydiales bacterium]|nr:AAA family ATPase [Chlamydiales bacterium]
MRLLLTLVFCGSLLAKSQMNCPEVLPNRYSEGVIQSAYGSSFDNNSYVVLDNDTAWIVYRLYGNAENWWDFLSDIKEVDKKLLCNPTSWKIGNDVRIYSLPFKDSLAQKLLQNPDPDLSCSTHLIFNRDRQQMAFARRLSSKEMKELKLQIKPIKVIPNKGLKTRLQDVVGYDGIRKEIQQIASRLKNPKPYLKLGAQLPQSLLITGPSGCGKTLLAKALAKESNRPLIQISASQLWDDFFLKDLDDIAPLFETARKNAPCIILIDGFDTFDFLGNLTGYDFLIARLNRKIELMTLETDAFLVITARDAKKIGAQLFTSNHQCQILEVSTPSKKDRIQLLQVHAQEFAVDSACDLEHLGYQTLCFTPADLKSIFHLGARIAAAKKSDVISQEDLEGAIRKIGRLKAEHSNGENNPAKLSDPFVKPLKFDAIGGCKEAKEELQELVAFLKNPGQFAHLGAKAPKGTLCIGPPGCGKTMLAKAVAGEAGCNFFHCSGADINSVWVGSGVSRIKEVFKVARANTPAILFIDEIDAVGGKRMNDPQAAARDFNNTLNQLLVEMDGFDGSEGLAVIAATNLPDLLDDALIRSGRFDRQVVIDLPSYAERLEILSIHCKSLPLEESVDLSHTARMTIGMSGADLVNILNEAALIAGRTNKKTINESDIREAHDKVQLGKERHSLSFSDEEKRHTAYHEAGHTIVGLIVDSGTHVDKVTIVPRGRALGLTHFIPQGENLTLWRKQAENRLAECLGGMAAERICLGDTSAGVSSDLKNATQLARQMVAEYGMNDTLGYAAFGHDLSSDTKRQIDIEVRKLLDKAYKQAAAIIEEYRLQVDQIVAGLLEKETLYRADLEAILKGPSSEDSPAA